MRARRVAAPHSVVAVTVPAGVTALPGVTVPARVLGSPTPVAADRGVAERDGVGEGSR